MDSRELSNRDIINRMIIMIIIVVIISVFYINRIDSKLTELSKNNTLEITNQLQIYIEDKLSTKLEQTEAVADYIGNHLKYEKYFDIREFSYLIRDKLFENLYMSNSRGEATSVKLENVDVSDREYFKKSLSGNCYISDPILHREDNENAIVYSVPIKIDDEIVGVLFTRNTIKEICEDLSLNSYSKKGSIYIVDRNGEIIATNKGDFLGENIKKNIKDIESTQYKFKLENSGVDTVKFNDKTDVVGYKKLNKMKDWYIVTSIPKTKAFYGMQELYRIIIIGAICIICIVICTSIYILKLKQRGKESIEKLAFEDSLTKISNYNKVIRDGQEFINKRNKRECTVICFDIRRFNFINDLYGYSTGDDILIYIASIMREHLVNGEVYGRLSNDIFCVITQNNTRIVEHIILEIEKEINKRALNGNNINIKLSAGVYELSNKDESIKACIDNANRARVRCKDNENIIHYKFDEAMQMEKVNDIIIQNDIVSGLKRNEFRVHYQPKFDINKGKIVGAEALIRWIHHDIGFMNPNTFIPIAEKTGHINHIGRWVFEQVCKDIENWIEHGYSVVPISINLSRVELYQNDLVEFLGCTCKKYSIDPKLIEIEITETSALNDVEFINCRINEIKKLGMAVSMDDFGVGNSTLSNLKIVNIDTLKIDRSLLVDIENSEKCKNVVISIIDLSKKLGLDVVCEGVENEEQVNILRRTKCSIVQGYVYSKPVEKEIFENNFLK